MRYCIILWDGNNLYCIVGPFSTKDAAEKWQSKDEDERAMRRTIVPLHKP